MIITKRTLLIGLCVILCLIAVLFGPDLILHCQRHFYGVKKGVSLDGYSVEGLLERELYDTVASLGEIHYIEAKNASWDWNHGLVQEEKIGQIVDVQATVKALLNAPPNTEATFVTVTILPSITTSHFQPYVRGSSLEPRVAIMINVDWGDEFIPAMLDVLRDYDVIVTWFPTGRWVKQAPELARQISLAGHEIGNHGGWHGMPSQMGRDEVIRLIQEGEDEITKATGQKPQIFAPPAGDYNRQTVAVAAELGYKTVLWTVDTVDWKRPAPTVIVDRVLSQICSGALVLMHPTQPTSEALPIVIDHLLTKGYQMVTVSELLSD